MDPHQPRFRLLRYISWSVKPGSTARNNFTVVNIGEPLSGLNWEISEYPSWGNWSFNPSNGDYLKHESGTFLVKVSVDAPIERNQNFSGHIEIVNKEDPSDYCIIDVSLSTPKTKEINTPFLNFLENHPHLLPLLRQLLRIQ